MMNFRFTFSIEGLGAREAAEDNAEALLDAFERTHPEVSASVGANLEDSILEVSFCADGNSLNDAAGRAGAIFVEAAVESGLQPSPLVGLEVEADLREPAHSHAIPRLKRRRGADSWQVPKQLAQAVG
jgi:hypothetical protein